MNKRVSLSLVALLLATACAANTAKEGVVKAPERSGGLFGLAKEDAVKVETADAFKGANDVVIGNFLVGFSIYKTDSAKAGGGLMGSGFGGKSTARSSLVGIDDATMQKITDQAYSQFISSLKAKGYKVVDRADLNDFEKFKTTKTYPNPYEDSTGGLFGTGSKTKYFTPKSFGEMRIFPGDILGVTGGFAFSSPMAGAMEYAKTKGVRVLNVVYVLDFANSEKYGDWHTNSSSVNVGQGMTIIPEFTKLAIVGGEMGTFSTANGVIRIGQPLTADREFATVTDSTSDTSKGVEMATNVIGLIGGIGTNISREYEFKATPSAYSSASQDVLSQATATMVGKMAALK